MEMKTDSLTILFADIGDSSALYEKVGDAEAYRLIADSLSRMKLAVETSHGTVLRTVGDAVLASFDRCDSAFEGARAIQLAHDDIPLSVRVGFHSGIVIPDGGDIYGHAVNLAARVAAFARVGEIVATASAVRELSPAHRAFASGIDRIDVRGIPERVEVHRLQWKDESEAVTRLASRGDYDTQPNRAEMTLRLSHGDSSLQVGSSRTTATLGRAEDNDIAVLNDEASRYHARIMYRHGQILLLDDSTNGTYVRKDGLAAFQVRRDSIVLDGRGVICLGAFPDAVGAELIAFELIQNC